MKVSLENVEATLLEKKVDPVKVQEILRDLLKAIEDEKENKDDKEEKAKWEHIIILNDKEGYLNEKEMSGWIVQHEEGEDPAMAISKLQDAARSQNEGAKTKKSRITDLLSLFEHLKPKFAKEKKVRVKTKELTRVIITNGQFR
jgi:hypothetical protein